LLQQGERTREKQQEATTIILDIEQLVATIIKTSLKNNNVKRR